TSADISFSPVNPAVGQPVTMTARVRNAGYTTAGPFLVEFRDFGIPLGTPTVAGLATGASTTASFSTSYSVAVDRLISVVADETKGANNSAARDLRGGQPQPLAGLINVAASSVTAYPLQVASATGTGDYDFPSVPGTQDFPVQGGGVTVEVLDATTLALRST